jgi:hypothetical protein
MEFIKPLAHRFARSRRENPVEYIRHGWNNYSFIFYIGGISAILGAEFGIAGWLSTIVTVAFFYYAGRFKKELDRERARLEREREDKKK